MHDQKTLKMFSAWLSGDSERDAKSFSRTFRVLRMSMQQWRDLVAQAEAYKAAQ